MTALARAASTPIRFRSTARSHVGRVRPFNEDRVFDDPDAGIWAVIDGMGGHSGGDLAAQQVVDSLRQGGDVRSGLAAANDLVHRRNRLIGAEAGATVVAASLSGGTVEIVWAGDSRAYRLGNRVAVQLTRDHSVVQQLVDAGALTPAQADRHPQANIVTRALGIEPALDLDTVRVAAAGRFLLCSDGLSRSLSAEDIDPALTLDALADRLVAAALRRDGADNISLVAFEIDAA